MSEKQRATQDAVGFTGWLDVGELCLMADWDKTEPPWKKVGSPARILKIRDEGVSQTGIMVLVRGETTGREVELDSAWLQPFSTSNG